MSFGWSVSDIALLVRLAYKTTQGARAACGEYDGLTRETYGLHVILQRLQIEADKPDSFINKPGETYKQELVSISSGCQDVLKQLDKILEKYNALGDKERSVSKLWKQVRFGSGVVADVADLRSKITSYTAELSLFINLVSMNTVGEVERQMNRAGGDLRDIKIAVNSITARLSASAKQEGSVFTAYTNDDIDAWRELRRGLARQGFRDGLVRRHMKTIMAYVKELGTRGILDDVNDHESGEGSRVQKNFYQIEEGTYNFSSIIRTTITSNPPDQIESKSPTIDLSPTTAPTCPNLSSDNNSKTNSLSKTSRQPYVESASESESDTHNMHDHLEQVKTCSTSPQLPDIISHDAAELVRKKSSSAEVLRSKEPSTDSEEEESHQGVTYRSGDAPGKHPPKASDTATDAQIVVQLQDTGAMKSDNIRYLYLPPWSRSLSTCTCKDTQGYINLLRHLHNPHFVSDGRVVYISQLHNALLIVQRFHALVEIHLKPEDPEEISYRESFWELEKHAMCLDVLSQMATISKQCGGAEPVLTTLRAIASDQVAALCVDFLTKYRRRKFDFFCTRTEEVTCLGFDDLIAKIRDWCRCWHSQLMPSLTARDSHPTSLSVESWCAAEKKLCAFHHPLILARRVGAFGETSTISHYYLQEFEPRRNARKQVRFIFD